MADNADLAGGRAVPGFAKGIILVQMLVIVFLSSWIVEEYLNNIYLQAYVNTVFQADGSLIAILVALAGVGGALGLFKSMRSSHGVIGGLVGQPEAPTRASAVFRSNQTASLHPMVAALKADMAHQSSMEPIPPLEAREVSAQALARPPPISSPVRTQTGTPSTVITGTMPVLKRVSPEQSRDEKSEQ